MAAFFKCGIYGWCLELIWTGFLSLCRGDGKLYAYSSLWMFPIYGIAAVIYPIYEYIKPLNMIFRGLIYMFGIFAVEYISGSILMLLHICPWDYSNTPFNIHGVIRLDFAPLWFTAGLIFEWLLTR